MSAAVGNSPSAPAISTVDDATEFDNGVARPVPSELTCLCQFADHYSQSQKGNRPSTSVRSTYLDVYGIVQSIVDKVVGEEDGAGHRDDRFARRHPE